jgi:hypothetical protein
VDLGGEVATIERGQCGQFDPVVDQVADRAAEQQPACGPADPQ